MNAGVLGHSAARADTPLSVLAVAEAGSLAAPTHGVRMLSIVRLSIALVLAANLGRIPIIFFANKDAPILVTDLGVIAVVVAAAYLALRGRSLRIDNIALTALTFAGIGALSALLAIPRFGLTPFQFGISIAYLLRWLVYFGLYLAIINFVRRSGVPSLWSAFEAMVLVFATFGIFQSIFLPGFAQMVYPESEAFVDWDIQGHRLVSTFLDPNFAGALIMMALLVMFAWLSMGRSVPHWKIILLATALVLTVSRSAVIGMMAGGLVILAARGISRRLLRTFGLLVALTLPFVPMILSYAAEYGKLSVGPSAIARVIMWGRALEIFLDNPVLGVGFNTYGFVQESYGYEAVGRASYTLDGGLLFVAVMTGTVGVTVFVAMLSMLVTRCRRIWRDRGRDAYDRGLALGVAAATVGLVVHSIFLNSLLLPFLMAPMWVFWGMAYLLRNGPEELENTADLDGRASAVHRPVPRLVALSVGTSGMSDGSGIGSLPRLRLFSPSGQELETSQNDDDG